MLCAIVAWSVAQLPMMAGLEDRLFDGSFTLRGRRATSAPVLLIYIDDESLDRLKKPAVFLSPELAEVVNHLHDQGAPRSASTSSFPIVHGLVGRPGRCGGRRHHDGGCHQAIRRGRAARMQVEGQRCCPSSSGKRTLVDPDPLRTDFGLVNLTEDGDQFVRRQQLAVRTVTGFRRLPVRPGSRGQVGQHPSRGIRGGSSSCSGGRGDPARR